ncbi:alpha-tocopherol transfer protein-like [Sitophilus oryzae]|uniref:Alpha-tocopherol transfer protein-like n=1 Tax=Sitophilus oryzae TaxID=7048 RepID=A0A6J2Y323_SITOR|nr:alpha-tocopherol transfer protein-like [Sitophilus oryzae]XP_030757272.1 alpha-tocopherol transfer protein-like [Sitophilus oryzae]XP_030757333.1 alpha-tocopherol transfer protein-like [Sitophilus oryzae]XP_030757400.1 alpha-tocopherol transfer protein-like [Sitophilus oryzae]
MLKLPYKFTSEQIVKEGRTSFENIEVVKRWLDSVDDQNIPVIQDELIVIFLLSCDNDIPLTKKTIKMYYQCKKQAPDIFDDKDMSRSDLQKGLNTVHMSSIPVRTEENYVVHFFKLNDPSYSNFDLVPIMKLSYMLLDITQEENLPNGLIAVIDMRGFSLMHLTRLKLTAIKNYLQFLQEGIPLQLKVIHVLNAVYFFDKIMNIIKVFMKTELINMIKVHPPNIESEKLFSLIPKQCLPEEYGGDLPSIEVLHEKTVKQYTEKQDFWKLEEKMRKNNN